MPSAEGAVSGSSSTLQTVTPIQNHLAELWLANIDLLVSMTKKEMGTDDTDPGTAESEPGTAEREPATTAGLLNGPSSHRSSPDICRGAGCAPSGTAATMSDQGPPSQTWPSQHKSSSL